MHNFVCLNHKILPVSRTNLPAISSAALYGRGVFTTLAIYDSEPFLWEKHWHRLTENANKIGIDLSNFDQKTVKESIDDLIKKNKITAARARITFFDTSASAIWKVESDTKTTLFIQTADLRAASDSFSLTVSPFQINSKSALVNVKSCSYLENILAFEDAKAKGFDEAVRLNERGEITSACLANIFWIKNEAIFTPDLKTGCLAGTTREFLIELAAQREMEVSFARSSLDSLLAADEVFLTSSASIIIIVEKVDKTYFKNEFSKRLKRDLYALKS